MWPHFRLYQPYFNWMGADVTDKMIRTALGFFPEQGGVRADAGQLPFRSASVDVVLLRHVLEHVPRWLMENILSEAVRVARRAVAVVFYVPTLPTGGVSESRRLGVFLETKWARQDVEEPISRSGWRLRPPVELAGDEVWILQPPVTPTPPIDSATPKFSIVLPTFRRAASLWKTVERIKAQTYTNWELIIIDNAGDVTEDFRDSRIQIHVHADRPSSSLARNAGLQYATGDYVCFFDDDDDMFPNYLQSFADAFAARPEARMVRCGIVLSDGRAVYAHCTPENCLRREYATPTWDNWGTGQDRRYFNRILETNGWTLTSGHVHVTREVLCRSNDDPAGGHREGQF
jgi:hypothetical protein